MTTTTAITCKLIDIHAHILHDMDHGSSSLESSIELLKKAKEIGIRDIVCTSHYLYSNDIYMSKFEELKKFAKKLKINLYIGNEVLINNSTIDEIINKRVFTINNTPYILVEFRRRNNHKFEEIMEYFEELISHNFKIIIAHPEQIQNVFKRKRELKKFKEMGVVFQINAYSFYKSFYLRHHVKRLLKYGFVDVIASDIHENTFNYDDYFKFYQYIKKNYGVELTNKLFYENPKKILNGKNL